MLPNEWRPCFGERPGGTEAGGREGARRCAGSVYLYGSVISGPMRRSSDIDIAVRTESDAPAGCMAGLRARIEDSRIPYSVDVVLSNEADPEFAGLVMRQGVRWIG